MKNHFRVDVVAAKLIQFAQPEVVTSEVCIRSIIGISSQVAEVLHQDKRAVELLLRLR
jgi:hypothetical protein